MSSITNPVRPPPADRKLRMKVFLTNRPHLSLAEWMRHMNQWVAISWDGTAIVASDPDLVKLDQKVRDLGIDPEYVGFEFVAPAEAADASASELMIEPGE